MELIKEHKDIRLVEISDELKGLGVTHDIVSSSNWLKDDDEIVCLHAGYPPMVMKNNRVELLPGFVCGTKDIIT